jgi:hypothetical protein
MLSPTVACFAMPASVTRVSPPRPALPNLDAALCDAHAAMISSPATVDSSTLSGFRLMAWVIDVPRPS